MEAAKLGELDFLGPEEGTATGADATLQIRARLAWNYFSALEARWDRQPPIGGGPLA